MKITVTQLRQIIKEEVRKAVKLHEHWDDDDYGDMDFRDPGGRSALRAGKLEFPCPTCGTPNVLTKKDVQLGYQCDACADAAEGYGGY